MRIVILTLLVFSFLTCLGKPQHAGPEYSNELVRKAESGDAKSQWWLANCYAFGLGIQKSEQYAEKWYKEAFNNYKKNAELGLAGSQKELGKCYDFGWGVAEDKSEAFKWYKKAAEQGESEAQIFLSGFYNTGTSVQKDQAEALKWLTKAANLGNPLGQFYLGRCYADGSGVLKNESEAVKWWIKSAEQGNPDAQYNLGLCYKYGKGVEKDLNKAEKWLSESDKQANIKIKDNRKSFSTGAWSAEEIESSFNIADKENTKQFVKEKLNQITNDIQKKAITEIVEITNQNSNIKPDSKEEAAIAFRTCLYWLAVLNISLSLDPSSAIDEVNEKNGLKDKPYGIKLKELLLKNYKRGMELGVLIPGPPEKGVSKTILEGNYSGQEILVENIIPGSICPEMENKFVNLEIIPSSIKNDDEKRVREKVLKFAQELYEGKVISEKQLNKIAEEL